jgi:hypothetical protein
MEGILPDRIRLREDKGNLSSGFTNGFIRLNPSFVERAIKAPPGRLRLYANPTRANDLREAVLQGDPAAAEALRLYRVVALSRWLSTVA